MSSKSFADFHQARFIHDIEFENNLTESLSVNMVLFILQRISRVKRISERFSTNFVRRWTRAKTWWAAVILRIAPSDTLLEHTHSASIKIHNYSRPRLLPKNVNLWVVIDADGNQITSLRHLHGSWIIIWLYFITLENNKFFITFRLRSNWFKMSVI